MRMFVKGVLMFAALWLCAAEYVVSSSRAWSPEQKRQERKEAGAVSTEELARTRALFNEKCARCHGEDGRGETDTGRMLGVPDFTDDKWQKEPKDDERFIASVTNGKEAMPAFGKKLSKQEIAALVAYVRRFAKPAR